MVTAAVLQSSKKKSNWRHKQKAMAKRVLGVTKLKEHKEAERPQKGWVHWNPVLIPSKAYGWCLWQRCIDTSQIGQHLFITLAYMLWCITLDKEYDEILGIWRNEGGSPCSGVCFLQQQTLCTVYESKIHIHLTFVSSTKQNHIPFLSQNIFFVSSGLEQGECIMTKFILEWTTVVKHCKAKNK